MFRFALDTLPKSQTGEVFKAFTVHEKKYGERAGIENVIVSKRRAQYEAAVAENSHNYDAWFDYIRLMEVIYNPPPLYVSSRKSHVYPKKNLPRGKEKTGTLQVPSLIEG